MDRLTKLTHFLPIHETDSFERLAKLYIKKIVKLHGVPVSIVSDRNPRFISHFLEALLEGHGFSTRF